MRAIDGGGGAHMHMLTDYVAAGPHDPAMPVWPRSRRNKRSYVWRQGGVRGGSGVVRQGEMQGGVMGFGVVVILLNAAADGVCNGACMSGGGVPGGPRRRQHGAWMAAAAAGDMGVKRQRRPYCSVLGGWARGAVAAAGSPQQSAGVCSGGIQCVLARLRCRNSLQASMY